MNALKKAAIILSTLLSLEGCGQIDFEEATDDRYHSPVVCVPQTADTMVQWLSIEAEQKNVKIVKKNIDTSGAYDDDKNIIYIDNAINDGSQIEATLLAHEMLHMRQLLGKSKLKRNRKTSIIGIQELEIQAYRESIRTKISFGQDRQKVFDYYYDLSKDLADKYCTDSSEFFDAMTYKVMEVCDQY